MSIDKIGANGFDLLARPPELSTQGIENDNSPSLDNLNYSFAFRIAV